MERKFKASELVRITGYSRKTIDLWLANGKFSVLVEGGRKYVTVSELLRVCPNVKLEDIEEKSSSSSEKIGTDTKQVENSEELLVLKTRIAEVEAQNKYLEKLVAIYERQIEELRADKEVAEQHHRDIVGVVELLKRGLLTVRRSTATSTLSPCRPSCRRWMPRPMSCPLQPPPCWLRSRATTAMISSQLTNKGGTKL